MFKGDNRRGKRSGGRAKAVAGSKGGINSLNKMMEEMMTELVGGGDPERSKNKAKKNKKNKEDEDWETQSEGDEDAWESDKDGSDDDDEEGEIPSVIEQQIMFPMFVEEHASKQKSSLIFNSENIFKCKIDKKELKQSALFDHFD